MMRNVFLFTTVLFLTSSAVTSSQDKKPPPDMKVPDGVFAVLRSSAKKADVLPLKDGEALVMHNHRYLKKDQKTEPLFVAVRPTPDVLLDLAEAPKADKGKDDVLRISVKLKQKAGEALEKLTRDRVGSEVAIVLDGEIVTMHKIRDVIKGGMVEITSCAPGAADHLLERLQRHFKK